MQPKVRRAQSAKRLVTAAWVLALAAGVAEATPGESRLVTIQKATGKPVASATLWRGAATGVSPVVGGGWAYYVENGETLCGLNLTSGKVLWRTQLATPAKFLAFASPSTLVAYDEALLRAFSRTNGRMLWEYDLRAIGEEWRLHEKMQFAVGPEYFVLCSSGQLLCLDVKTREPIWGNQNAGLAERPTPILTEENLFVRAAGEGIRWLGFRLADGAPTKDPEPPAGAVRPTTNDQRPMIQGQEAPTRRRSGLAVAPDGRSLTATVGSRRWSYRAPEPFAIGRVVSESGSVVLLQLVTGVPQSARR
jgi:hypothetical protein